MKHFLIALLFPFFIQSQDTIYFRTGETKATKVLEIGVKEIKYQRFNMADGPMYTVNKNEIFKIKFSGGQVDSFKVDNSVILQSAPNLAPATNLSPNNNKINYAHGRYYDANYNYISRRNIYLMVEDAGKKSNNKELLNLMKRTQSNYTQKQVYLGVGIGSFAFGIFTLYSLFLKSSSYYIGPQSTLNYLTVTGLLGINGIFAMSFSHHYHQKYKEEFNAMVDAYNKN